MPLYPRPKKMMIHNQKLISDGDVKFLHKFAEEKLGLDRSKFLNTKLHPCYELDEQLQEKAIAAGAVEVKIDEIMKLIKRNKSNLNKGFTIIEIIVAFVLICIVIGVLSLFVLIAMALLKYIGII